MTKDQLPANVLLASSHDDDDDDDDPGPDDDDDPEGDCMSFHQCSGSQWGYCLLRKGHAGAHYCTKCASEFW